MWLCGKTKTEKEAANEEMRGKMKPKARRIMAEVELRHPYFISRDDG